MKINNRLESISEYHFKKVSVIKENLKKKGIKVVDFGIGDPDLPVDNKIKSEIIKSCLSDGFNNYPPYDGIAELKLKIIDYYQKVYGVTLDMDEVIILIGSKEGINNIIPAACNISDVAIIPNPGYPVYESCCRLWGVKEYRVALSEKNNYLPDLNTIPEYIRQKSKIFFVNYPNNPTGAVANGDFYKEIIKFSQDYNILVCNDGAYMEIINEKSIEESILKYDKNKISVEFGTFSKTFNMTGFRIGYAVGNKEAIRRLGKVKSNVDSGQFIPIQKAAIAALDLDRSYIIKQRLIYDERKEVAEKYLNIHNIKYYKGEGTFYLWCKVPNNYTTDEFCEELLMENGIIVTPGYTFGSINHGYFRIALTKPKEIIENALKTIKNYE